MGSELTRHRFSPGDLVCYEDEAESCICIVVSADYKVSNVIGLYRPGEPPWYSIPRNLKLINLKVL